MTAASTYAEDLLAKILADPDFEPELLARAIADTSDLPHNRAETDERLARRRRRKADMGIVGERKLPPLVKPPRADRFDCLAFGASCRHTLLSEGSSMATPLPCGKCDPDREWRVFLKMVRYRHLVQGGDQTIVQIPGFENADTARKWATKQARRYPRVNVCLIRQGKDYLKELVIIYPDPMPNDEQMTMAQAILKVGLSGHVETRHVRPSEFMALVPRDACMEGVEINPDTGQPYRRRTCVFTGWPDFEDEPSDYLHDDGYIETGITNPRTEPTPLPGWAKVRSALPLEERAALNVAEWCAVATLAEYVGPSGLKNDAEQWQVHCDKTTWREAYRPMLRLLGAENKAPPTKCQGCGLAMPLTPRGLCIACELLSG